MSDFLDSGPALVIGTVLAGLFIHVGVAHLWGRILALLICGIYGGYVLRGVAARRLWEQYPGARGIWLLTIGMTTSAVVVATRMALPATQGTAFDLTWLGVASFAILAFAVVDRKNKDVTR